MHMFFEGSLQNVCSCKYYVTPYGISTKIPVLAWMRALGVLKGLQLILLRISH